MDGPSPRPLRSAGPPPSTRRLVGIAAVYALAIGFGVALFSGNIPGLPAHVSSFVTLNGHDYYPDEYDIPSPPLGSNISAPLPVSFHNVTFWVWVTNWGAPTGGYVHVNGTEANGSAYSCALHAEQLEQPGTTLYVSPDSRFAAAWNGGWFLELMVEVSPS
jgi:hypothetical protein